jgi:Stage II sporulation protein E (SpoIIE)
MVTVALAAQRDHADRPAITLAGGERRVVWTTCRPACEGSVPLITASTTAAIRRGRPSSDVALERSDQQVNELEQNGMIIGFLESQKYSELEEPLQANHRFVMYTDGLIEVSGVDDATGRPRSTPRRSPTMS